MFQSPGRDSPGSSSGSAGSGSGSRHSSASLDSGRASGRGPPPTHTTSQAHAHGHTHAHSLSHTTLGCHCDTVERVRAMIAQGVPVRIYLIISFIVAATFVSPIRYVKCERIEPTNTSCIHGDGWRVSCSHSHCAFRLINLFAYILVIKQIIQKVECFIQKSTYQNYCQFRRLYLTY